MSANTEELNRLEAMSGKAPLEAVNGLTSNCGLFTPYADIQQAPVNYYAQPRPVPKVHEAIINVMDTVGKEGIAKAGSADFGGVKRAFRGIDQVYNALNRALVGAKLTIIPSVVDRKIERIEKTSPGYQGGPAKVTTTHIYGLLIDYKITCATDGSYEVMRIFVEGFDTSDKGTGKAFSYAYKCGVLQLFCIPLEGQEDQDAHDPKIESASHDWQNDHRANNGGQAQQRRQDPDGQAQREHSAQRKASAPQEPPPERNPNRDGEWKQTEPRIPRMMGSKQTYANAGKFANELSDEALYNRIRQLSQMSNITEYAGLPEHLADLKTYAGATRGIKDFSRKTEVAYPRKEAETSDHLYVCVMPGKSSYGKHIRELDVEVLTRYLTLLQGETKVASKPERIKLVQEEIETRFKQEQKS